jgi:hypothetical protein
MTPVTGRRSRPCGTLSGCPLRRLACGLALWWMGSAWVEAGVRPATVALLVLAGPVDRGRIVMIVVGCDPLMTEAAGHLYREMDRQFRYGLTLMLTGLGYANSAPAGDVPVTRADIGRISRARRIGRGSRGSRGNA